MTEGERARLTGRYGLLLLTLIAAYLFSALGHDHHEGPLHIAFAAAIGLLALRNIRTRTGPATLAVGITLVTAIAAGFCVMSTNSDRRGNRQPVERPRAADDRGDHHQARDPAVRGDGAEPLRGVQRLPADRPDVLGLFRLAQLPRIRAVLRPQPAGEPADAAVFQLHHAHHPGLRRLHRRREPGPGGRGARGARRAGVPCDTGGAAGQPVRDGTAPAAAAGVTAGSAGLSGRDAAQEFVDGAVDEAGVGRA